MGVGLHTSHITGTAIKIMGKTSRLATQLSHLDLITNLKQVRSGLKQVRTAVNVYFPGTQNIVYSIS